MKYRTYIIALLVLFVMSKPSYSIEAEKIEVEFEQTKKIVIQDITRFFIVDNKIAIGKLDNGSLIITGLSYGSTPLFIWKNNQLISYIIYSIAPKQNYKNYSSESTAYINYNKPVGNYSVVATSNNDSSKNSNQNVNSLLNYRFPAYDGFISFNGGFSNLLSNLNTLENISINNLQTSYTSNNILISLGETYNPINSVVSSIRGSVRGGQFQYRNNLLQVSVFSGLESYPLTLYAKNTLNSSLQKSAFLSGFSGNFNVLSNLNLSTSYILRNESNRHESNLTGSVRWNPFNAVTTSLDLGTNFNGKISYNGLIGFSHNWNETKEYIRLNANLTHIDKNYLFNVPDQRDSYYANLQIKHRSDLLLSGSISHYAQSLNINDYYSIRASKNISKYSNLYAETNFNFAKYDIYNQYQLGFNSSNYLPINLNYSYTNGTRGTSISEHEFSGYADIFENEIFRTNLSLSIKKNNSLYIKESLGNIFTNFNLSLFYKLTKQLDLSSNISYSRAISDNKNQPVNNSYSLQLSGSWQPSVYHKINTGFGISKSDFNSFSLFSTIGYSYYFGAGVDEGYTVGNIKGVVYEDINNNNTFDLGEKVFNNVKVISGNKIIKTDDQGFVFKDLDYNNYEINIDKETLPKGYRLSTDIVDYIRLNEHSKVYNIPIRYESVIKGYIYAGKNKGLSDIKITLDNNQSTLTDSEGYFFIKTLPGKHSVKIDYTTIPQGYSFNDSLTKEVETVNNDAEISFLFKPIKILKIQAYKASYPGQKYSIELKPFKDLDINIIYADGKVDTVKTDEDGIINLEDLNEGTLEISSKALKENIKIEIPEDKFEKEIYIPVLTKLNAF